MLDMEMKTLMEMTNKAWENLAKILDNASYLNESAPHNIMLTINARYLNACSKSMNNEGKNEIKQEYYRVIEEKLGNNNA